MGATERVVQFIEYKGISKYKFNKDLGFSNKFLDNSSNMGTDKACKILHYFPDLNPEWLLTGKGEMLKSSPIQLYGENLKSKDIIIPNQEVPFYNFEATAGLKELFNSNVPATALDTIKIPNLPNCDGAISVTGDSMYPLLKSGDIILYKQIPNEMQSIYFGEMYLVGIHDEFDEYITVKYVQKSEKGDEYIKLVSQNQHHQPKDIHFSKVTAMALIKASIRFNTMF